MRPLILLAVGTWMGCSGSGGDQTAPDAAPQIDATEAGDAAPPGWESVEELSNDGQVIVERVSYRSDGLRVYARICRPADTAQHRVAVYNHGGFSGLSLDPTVATCEQSARFGYVWIASTYRGEEGSDGAIEVCHGEVDDVLRMIDIVRAQPYADPDRVLMWGGSHGGCITLRAVQRGAPVRAAVAIYPPTDLARVHAFWQQRIAAGDPQASTYQQLRGIVETATGGSPSSAAAAYAARSPQGFMSDVPVSLPLLVTHGAADTIVPVLESCSIATSASATSIHINSSEQPTAVAPPGCASSGLTWSTTYPRATWPGARYFVAYDGLGHDISGAVYDAMQQDVATFLMAKVP